MLVVVGLPLSFTSADIAARSITEAAVHDEVNRWSVDAGWSLTNLIYSRGEITVYLEGPLPLPDTVSLETALSSRGVDVDSVRLVLVPVYEVKLGDSTPH